MRGQGPEASLPRIDGRPEALAEDEMPDDPGQDAAGGAANPFLFEAVAGPFDDMRERKRAPGLELAGCGTCGCGTCGCGFCFCSVGGCNCAIAIA